MHPPAAPKPFDPAAPPQPIHSLPSQRHYEGGYEGGSHGASPAPVAAPPRPPPPPGLHPSHYDPYQDAYRGILHRSLWYKVC